MNIFRILVAEDNKEVQAACCHILRRAGYAVDIAEDGMQAVEAARMHSYDLVLMDLEMPAMNGITAVKEIRSHKKDGNVPIIAFTSLSDDTLRRQCRAEGIDDFLVKPVGEEILLACIDRWLNKRPAILIADDMEDSRKLIEHHLRNAPFSVIFAKNGIEAVAAFHRDKQIALILLDMEMPVMDGYTAARALASLMTDTKVPIIAMTAHEGEREATKCLKAGCTGFLGKPVTQEALMQVITEHIDEKGACSQRRGEIKTLGEYVVHIDPSLKELVPRYLDNRHKDITEIRRLLAAGDLEAVRIIGHNMAGSAGGYGFPEIGKLGKEIEGAALRAHTQGIGHWATQLADYLSRITVVAKEEEGKTT